MLAVRFRMLGPSRWHDRLMADGAQWVNEIRAQGQEIGGDRLWIERVKIATRAPSRSLDETGDGPIDALMSLVDSYRQDPEKLRALAERMTDLRRKLPPELTSGDDPIALDDPDWLRAMLDRVGPLLLHRLRAANEPLS